MISIHEKWTLHTAFLEWESTPDATIAWPDQTDGSAMQRVSWVLLDESRSLLNESRRVGAVWCFQWWLPAHWKSDPGDVPRHRVAFACFLLALRDFQGGLERA